MKHLKYISIFLSSLFVLTSCQEDEHELGPITPPTNLAIETEIVGADANNQSGDGTGFVSFSVTADAALAYQFNFGDGNSETNSSGITTHRYTQVGINTYTVIISAVGTAGVLSSQSLDIEVYSAFEDPEAETFLAGANEGDSKTWVWDSTAPSYLGLGPVEDDYGNLDFSWPNWWNNIGPNDAEKACMTDNNIFVFTKTANGLTFEQTAGPAFVPGAYASIIGVAGDQCHNEDVATTIFGVKNVSFLPSSSKAALEGELDGEPYRQTSFKLSDGGFMGWYVGNVEYDIISITANTLHVRCIQEGGGFAWYAKYKSE